MRAAFIISLIAALIVPALGRAPDDDDVWAKGIPYTTKWDEAIKQARESGKMLFIYNGWQRPGI